MCSTSSTPSTCRSGQGKHFFGQQRTPVERVHRQLDHRRHHQYRSGALLALTCANTLGNGVLFTDARMCDANPGAVRTGQGRTSLDPNNPASIYFNAAAFSVPAQFSFGTSSQYNGHFRQPPVLVDNIALVKQLPSGRTGDGSRMRLQFSANAFNPFNRTNFAVNGAVGNANFGRATGPQYGPRIITMIVRLYF